MNDKNMISDLVPVNLTQKSIAEQMNVKQQSVSEWFCNNIIPPRRVPEFSRITGIPRCKLNPLFAHEGQPENKAA